MVELALGDLTLSELKKLQRDVGKAIADFDGRKRSEALAAAEAAVKDLGFSLSELMGSTKAKSGKVPSPAKYKHPENPALTWTGRGRKPGWIKEAEEDGIPLENFLI